MPRVTVKRKAPEIVEQHGGGDHVEYEQQRCLPAIEAGQDADRAEDFEQPARTKQQGCERGRQRYPSMRGLGHGGLEVEDLIERAEREYDDQTKPGDESEE